MNNRFQGKVALVTGGGTGIGAATARRIASEGGKVVVTGRRIEPITRVAEELGGIAVAGDATDLAHLQEAVAVATARFGGVDILVANAGQGFSSPVAEMDVEGWRRTLALNLDAPMLASRTVIPAMRNRGGGAIVHVSSVAAFFALPAEGAYMASKAGLLGLNRSVARDYGPEGIRSNVVCPAFVPTEMAEHGLAGAATAMETSVEALIERIGNVYPLRRVGKPEEIASAICFLASNDASFITGTVLVVDGGGSIVDPATLA